MRGRPGSRKPSRLAAIQLYRVALARSQMHPKYTEESTFSRTLTEDEMRGNLNTNVDGLGDC